MNIYGKHDDRTIQQLARCVAAEEGAIGVLCADGHLGYSCPIGGVIAYRNYASPSGVGYDIACGNMAVQTNIMAVDIPHAEMERLADEIQSRISFGVGRKNNEPVDSPVFDQIAASSIPQQRSLIQMAQQQLGTVGSGNHYVDILEDEAGVLWIGVHFGSRGFGHRTATGFMNIAQGKAFDDGKGEGEMDAPPLLLDIHNPSGQDYIEAMTIAGAYAYAGREAVVSKVLEILGATAEWTVHNNHNFCLPGDAVIPTPDGPVSMRELVKGNKVYAFDSATGLVETNIIATQQLGLKEIFTIQTSSRKIRASAEHPILTIQIVKVPYPDKPKRFKEVGELVWKTADKIKPKDIIVCAEGYYATDGIAKIDPRLAGAFLGDGWRRNSKASRVSGYSLGLAIGGVDDPHTAKYLDLCRAELPARTWHNNVPGAFGLSASSVAAHNKLDEAQLTGESKDRVMPSWAFKLPVAEKLAILAGYFDADGSVAGSTTSNHGRGTIASTSLLLVMGLRELAIGACLRTTAIRKIRVTTNFGPCIVYHCVLSRDSIARLDLWHEKKLQNIAVSKYKISKGLQLSKIGYLNLPIGTFAQTVKSVHVQEAEEVFDITVDHGSHSFVADGVVVHNCWQEHHNGEDFWVVRKGSTPAFPGQFGFVGGSMGDISVILKGVESEASAAALYSTVHGAGRLMSRTQAAGKQKWIKAWMCGQRDCDGALPISTARNKDGSNPKCPKCGSRTNKRTWMERIQNGLVDFDAEKALLVNRGIVLRGAGADEAPPVYRPLQSVLDAHAGTIEVVHTLQPRIVVMAGADVKDPYAD